MSSATLCSCRPKEAADSRLLRSAVTLQPRLNIKFLRLRVIKIIFMYLPRFFVVLLYPTYIVRKHIEFYAGGLICQYFWHARDCTSLTYPPTNIAQSAPADKEGTLAIVFRRHPTIHSLPFPFLPFPSHPSLSHPILPHPILPTSHNTLKHVQTHTFKNKSPDP